LSEKENLTKFLDATFLYLKTVAETELPACLLKHFSVYISNVEDFRSCYKVGKCNECPVGHLKGRIEMKQVDIVAVAKVVAVAKEALKEIVTIADDPRNKDLLSKVLAEEKQLHPELKTKYEELENLLKIKSKSKEGFDIPVN
jgi:hypothetical protein